MEKKQIKDIENAVNELYRMGEDLKEIAEEAESNDELLSQEEYELKVSIDEDGGENVLDDIAERIRELADDLYDVYQAYDNADYHWRRKKKIKKVLKDD